MTNKCLLIAEPDAAARMEIVRFFKDKRPHWRIHQADGGFQAMDIAMQEVIDYFTVDYYLPDLPGLEMIIDLKRVHLGGEFVLLTTPLSDHVKTEIEALSVACFEKPINELMLTSVLRHFEN